MRRALPVVFVLSLAGCASTAPPAAPAPAAPAPGNVQRASANIVGASGSLVSGRLMLEAMAGGVHVHGDLGGLAPNSTHGFHVHETGDCSAADAASAGGHYNPTNSAHGRAEAPVHHAGDIDNIVADASGVAHVNAHLAGVTLGGDNAIVGRALVVHAAPDDYQTQPSGNSGARIGCGVIAAQP